MNLKTPQYQDIKRTYERIHPFIHNTPVLTSKSVDALLGVTLFFKCENFQKVGAFKYRGATNAILSLTPEEMQKGVATHSSGNHAAALALAAKKQKVTAYIVMPESAPEVKKKAVAGYGARITFCESTLEARETTLKKVVDKTGATFIHPYNNFDVICGQGTCAYEFLEEIPDLDILMTPVGGGGLLSGSAIMAKYMKPGIRLIGAEPRGDDDAFRSFQTGILVPSVHPQTIADGLLTSLSPLTFSIIRDTVDQILTTSESSIIQATRMIWERMKIIIEPSSAVPLAAILEHPEQFQGTRTGIILTGGNIDLGKLAQLFN